MRGTAEGRGRVSPRRELQPGHRRPPYDLVIGAFVAGSHNYFQNLNTLEAIVSALLAIALWPLVLLNVNLRVNF